MGEYVPQFVKDKAVAETREEYKKHEEKKGRHPTGREVEQWGTGIAEEHDREESERRRR